ncbi:MAG: proline dehydrogenase [Ignavibacteriae bacterium]|nr:MAG: proline dehydrogenase [Ignavibacteriota bacterium]
MLLINKLIVAFVKLLPKTIVHLFAKKYIAGETLDDAVRVVKELNAKGIVATIDVLGEAISTKEEAIHEKDECLRVLDTIQQNNLNANLSTKPTSLGLNIDTDFYLSNMREVLDKAKKYNNFVRLDMEDSSFTTPTIEVFQKLRKEYDNLGLVVQAYLKRTEKDVDELNKIKSNYRLCKGIYIEPAEIAFKDKQEIRDNYLLLLKKILKNKSYVGIATHDDILVESAYKIIKEMNLEKNKYEFQMLYGVQEKLRDQVNANGHLIRIYVPYGKKWYEYSVRRMQENPEIAGHITKSIFGL